MRAAVPPDAYSALRVLLRASHVGGPDELPAMVTAAGEQLGASLSVLYLVDYEQQSLEPMMAPGDPRPAESVDVDATLAGRAFTGVAQQLADADDIRTVWTPVLDGTDRLGVLQLQFPGVVVDDELLSACQDVAGLIAELVMTRSVYGDAIERTRRRKSLSVPAEMQWRLLPPLTFVSSRFSIAGVLAPAENVAGDSFDYAANGDLAHVAIIDAMGHGLEAALLAAVTISTLRNARRNGADLVATVAAVDSVIAAQFGPDKFVTGVFGELDTTNGWWRWTTCGHPPVLLLRGGRVVRTLDSVIGAPLGLGLLEPDPPVGQERLEPGDRLLLYTDGVLDARDADGNFFGPQRLADFVTREEAAGLPAAETLRRLNRAILHHQQGSLQDDATTVLVEWLTDQPRRSTPDGP
jgi:serine phosphatase RsbU (regulator of sigma subunit)